MDPTHIFLTHGHADHIGDTVDIAKRTGAQTVAIVELANEIGGDGVENVADPNIGGTVEFEGGWVRLVPAWHTAVSPNGTPLRARVGVTIKEQDEDYETHARGAGAASPGGCGRARAVQEQRGPWGGHPRGGGAPPTGPPRPPPQRVELRAETTLPPPTPAPAPRCPRPQSAPSPPPGAETAAHTPGSRPPAPHPTSRRPRAG